MSKSSRKILRDKFLDWQCRIRQVVMREAGGRPSPGMRPQILDKAGAELAPALTVLLVPKAPTESTAFFRYQVMKYSDPREVYEKALTFLQAEYFGDPKDFSDFLLAVLPENAPLANKLLAAKKCVLVFAQGRRSYRLPCKVKALKDGDANRDAAIWHNRVFNPALPETVHILTFEPDWASAQAEPGRKT